MHVRSRLRKCDQMLSGTWSRAPYSTARRRRRATLRRRRGCHYQPFHNTVMSICHRYHRYRPHIIALSIIILFIKGLLKKSQICSQVGDVPAAPPHSRGRMPSHSPLHTHIGPRLHAFNTIFIYIVVPTNRIQTQNRLFAFT